MVKHIKQFRFFSEGDNKNYPSNMSLNLLCGYNGKTAFDGCYPIRQVGIQALPGTKVYFNDALEPITINYTGIYELDLKGRAEISKITFDKLSLRAIQNTKSSYLIIDIVYEGGND